MKKSERMIIFDKLLAQRRIETAIDFLHNPIVSMITGVSVVNVLSRIRDENNNPVLFSEGVRVGLQTAALGYPLFAGGRRDTKETAAFYATILTAVGIGNISGGSAPAQESNSGALDKVLTSGVWP